MNTDGKYTRGSRVVMVTFAIILGLLWTGPAMAQQTAPAVDPSGWMPMDGPHAHWFSFEVGRYEDDPVSFVNISLTGRPHNDAAFQVFDSRNWDYWGEPDPEKWIGMSTPGSYGGATWGGPMAPGAYFVRVAAGGDHACQLGISGPVVHNVEMIMLDDGVPDTFVYAPETTQPAATAPAATMPVTVKAPPTEPGYDFTLAAIEPAMPAATTPVMVKLPPTEPGYDFKLAVIEPAAPAPSAPAPVPVVQTVAAPVIEPAPVVPAADTASMLMRPGEWMPIMDTDPHWFFFEVGRIEGEGNTHVAVSLTAEPFNGGRFRIYEAGKAPFAWGTPEEAEWLGESAVSDADRIAWAGDLPAGGYYVKVEPLGTKSCLLAVTGQTVVY